MDDGTPNPSDPTLRDAASEHRGVARPPANYTLGPLLGRGGMGEVMLAEDIKLGRHIAIKRMRAGTHAPEAIARFLREARIQALLDHPAIVPVHELGRDDNDLPYFTMKRLAGKTLHDVLRDGDARLQRLLRAFVDVCHAIEYAHARNIVHRDLKPTNVMLGDYGEVYVLDWGVARVLGETEQITNPINGDDAETQTGAVLGTPGYMSPEQLRGETVTVATDVYALGAILYEILTGEPLHPRASAMASTLADRTPTSLAKRFPERAIAPELDAACVAALAETPEVRPRASELAARVEQYLDGDRDVERRRVLAVEHLIAARAALETRDDRAEAMRLAGRALALDPESSDAAGIVTQLMIEPSEPPSPALAKRLEAIDSDDVARQARSAAFALAGYLLFLPVIAVIGVNDWVVVGGVAALIAFMIAGCIYIAASRSPYIAWTIFGTIAALVVIAQMFSPIVIAPALAVGSVAALAASPTLRPWSVTTGMVIAVILPITLEHFGVVPEITAFSSSGISIAPNLVDFGPTSTPILITTIHVATVVIVGLLVRSIARGRRESQRRLERQAWMLEQLLPARA